MLFERRIPIKRKPLTEQEVPLYERYARLRGEYKDHVLSEITRACPGGLMLDMDSELGYTGIGILRKDSAAKVVALASSPQLRIARQGADIQKMQKQWRPVEGSQEYLPFASASFDIVVSSDSLHQWENPIQTLREARRVLKRGGRLYISDLRRSADEAMIKLMILDWKGRETQQADWFLRRFVDSWRSSYSPSELDAMARQAGLDHVEVETDGPMALLLKAEVLQT